MPTVVQDVSGDSDLQAAIATLKAKIEGAAESEDIRSLNEDIANLKDALMELVPAATGNSVDVSEYAGKSIRKVTSAINAGTAVESVKLFCAGKNHLKLKTASGTSGGITWVNDPVAGTVILNGTATGKVNLFFGFSNSPFAESIPVYNAKWRASIAKSAENSGVRIGFNGNPATSETVYEGTAGTTSTYYMVASVLITSGTTCDNLVVSPMLEFGDYPETVSFEPYRGFVEEHTFEEAVTTVEIDWGALDIPVGATTLWLFDASNTVTIYEQQIAFDELETAISNLGTEIESLSEQIGAVDDRVDGVYEQLGGIDDQIDGAYAHEYEDDISGWDDVTYYTTGFINDAGEVVTYGTNSYWYTDFIPVKKKDRITYRLYGNKKLVTFYNANHEKVSNITGESGKYNEDTVLVPEGAAFLKFCEQHGSPSGTFSIERWTAVSPDESSTILKAYADSLATIVDTSITLTMSDVTIVEGEMYNNRGFYTAAESMHTDYIPVSEGDTIAYRLYGNVASPLYQYLITAFNENKIELSHVGGEENGYISGTYTVPSGAAYVIISWMRNWLTKNGWFVIHTSSYSRRVIDYLKAQRLHHGSIFKGKQWCCMGDSITSGQTTVRPYYNWIQDRTGITPYNFGMSSTAITKDTASTDHNMATRFLGMFDAVDYVTVFGGTNDHGRRLQIGQWGDNDQLTLYGAMKIMCEGLITKYMGKKIGFMTPLPKCTTSNDVTTDYSYPSETFVPYIECIKDVCARYSIPVLDLYTQSGMHPSMADFREAYMPDGLHPNSAGQELLSYRIQHFLETL